MTTTIYHNPQCSVSRRVLDMLRASGAQVNVIPYLRSPPSRETVRRLISDSGLTVRDAIRTKEDAFAQLGLASLGDVALLDAIQAHPELLQRPFVTTPLGTRLARPVDRVLEIMANPPARAP